jgi:hypothetical protein
MKEERRIIKLGSKIPQPYAENQSGDFLFFSKLMIFLPFSSSISSYFSEFEEKNESKGRWSHLKVLRVFLLQRLKFYFLFSSILSYFVRNNEMEPRD